MCVCDVILRGQMMMPERRAGEGEREEESMQKIIGWVAWAMCAVRRRVEEIVSESHQ